MEDSLREKLEYLASLDDIDSSQLEKCTKTYNYLLEMIPRSDLFIEPHPWPETQEDLHGTLYASTQFGNFIPLPQGRKLVLSNINLTSLQHTSIISWEEV